MKPEQPDKPWDQGDSLDAPGHARGQGRRSLVQTDECASGGLPVDRVTAVRVVDRLIMRHEQPAEPAAAQAIEAVIDRLQELLRPAGTDRA